VSLPPLSIPFVKASACGNDFLLIDTAQLAAKPSLADLTSITQRICNRHEGVGADGVEWLYPHTSADIEIRLINADGSEAEISGNGTRCVAAYLYSETKKEKVKIQTGAGLKTCTLITKTKSGYEFEADMGEAVIEPELAVKLDAAEVRGIPLSMGNPHYVVFVPEFPMNWQEQATNIQRSSHFKHGVNVELVIADGEHDVNVRFFERGVGETQSSGTGSCASALAAITTSRAKSPVNVHAPGGVQNIRVDGNRVFLRGQAQIICKGDFFLS